MKEQPRTQVTYFRNSNFKHKMKTLQAQQKLVYEKFIKNLLPEKRKENM